MITKFIFNAVDTLDPEGTTSISVTDDDTDQILFLSNPKKITVQQIIDKIPEVEAEYDEQAYARARQPLYPKIGDQLDDLYHKGAFSTEMEAKIKKVKDDNPKPE